MELNILNRLEKLNQVKLTDEEKKEVLAFFEKVEKDIVVLDSVDTSNVERMVHVMPMSNVIREDIVEKRYTREQLQEQGPEVTDGYWQVPLLVE